MQNNGLFGYKTFRIGTASAVFRLTRPQTRGKIKPTRKYAGMMELADMQDLGSCAVMRWGSNPHARTKNPECVSVRDFYLLLFHYSLFTKLRIRDFWKVTGNSE